MQMLLAVPAGMHFNALLHGVLKLQTLAHADSFSTVLKIDVALAAVAVPAAFLLRHAPPSPPCASAEQPYPAEPRAPGSVSPTSSRAGHTQLHAYSPGRSGSTPLSDAHARHGAAARELAGQRGARGQGCQRGGLLADVPRLLRAPSFVLLLVAFSLTVSALLTYYLNVEEFLDRPPEKTGVNVAKLLGSAGAVAFTAGASLQHAWRKHRLCPCCRFL
jgi:hypothetical protein